MTELVARLRTQHDVGERIELFRKVLVMSARLNAKNPRLVIDQVHIASVALRQHDGAASADRMLTQVTDALSIDPTNAHVLVAIERLKASTAARLSTTRPE